MDLRYTFDAERFYLGTLCMHGHRWPSTDQSLRRAGTPVNSCIGCTGRKQSSWLISFIDAEAMGLPAGWRFGKLCKAGHRWEGHEMSLKNRNGKCVECERVKRAMPQTRERLAQWRLNNKARLNEASRKRHAKLRDDLAYRLYHRQKSKRRKALMRNSVAIQVTGRVIKARFAEFGYRCAYCGDGGDLHIEHVVPISKGGGHAIGNMVPACKECNYSKATNEVEAWYRSQAFYSEVRWRKICRVLGWQRSSVGQLALL